MDAVLANPADIKSRSWFDWAYAAAVVVGALVVANRYALDGFDKATLLLATGLLVAQGWHWKRFRGIILAVASLSLLSVSLYGGDLGRSATSFGLKYLLASQSAIMWMSALFVFATFAYWFGLAIKSDFSAKVGSWLTVAAAVFGATGLMARWYESYLISPDVGHVPVSNLYEVFVLFSVFTALMYLYYEDRYRSRQLGAFALPVISAAVGFLLWYAATRGAHHIQPLVPALQSYWMKLHVPSNFIGYGGFALAAMAGVAYLLAEKGILASRLPRPEVIDDVMYRLVAIGFAFFTIATILGALWAAEAWGSYWSWDPKETWALIVWLNYAAWLHLRLMKGLRGRALAWWAVVGLFVTAFAFLGVNMFLSGLHSYGTL